MIKQYLKIILPIFLIVLLQSCAAPGKKPKSVHGEKPLIDTAEIKYWNKFVEFLGYKYWDETNNQTYKLFLGASD